MNQYAEVILNIPVNQSFTYILPHTITNAKAGMRAEVRLGNRRMTAFIIKIHQTPPQNFPIEKLKPVIINHVNIYFSFISRAYTCYPSKQHIRSFNFINCL